MQADLQLSKIYSKPREDVIEFGVSEQPAFRIPTQDSNVGLNAPMHSPVDKSEPIELLQVCDPTTGVCLPSPPLIASPPSDEDRRVSIKTSTIQSLAVSANDATIPPETIIGKIGKLFSQTSTPLDIDTKNDNLRYFIPPQIGYAEITKHDVEAAIGKSYVDLSHNHFESNALDVLALYIKGQKLLYTEAKTYCEQQLNFLMLPAIFISCVGSIFSFLSKNYEYGPLIIASLNGFNAFLLALISYLKLDAKAQAHKTSAYKFDKLESMCEFNSGRFMFFTTDVSEIVDVVDKIEAGVCEIKETNQFILPESIRYEFSFTYSTNVFMLVKKTQSTEISEIHNLKNCVNYITKLREQLASVNNDPNSGDAAGGTVRRLTDAIQIEEIRKNQIVRKIVDCRTRYFDLDEQFNKEIKKHMRRANRWFITRVLCCDWLKS